MTIRRLALTGAVAVLVAAPAAIAATHRYVNASHVPLGYYSCRVTLADSHSASGYTTAFAGSFTLSGGGKYNVNNVPGRWSSAHNKLTFKGGTYDNASVFARLSGRYVRAGLAMPHDQFPGTWTYTVTLRSVTSAVDTAPPSAESDAHSLWYCARR